MFTLEGPPNARTIVNGRPCLYFVGTGYLGLQARAEPRQAAEDALRRYGLHAATTRAGLGNVAPLVELEREAARFFNVEDSLYLVSGYACNRVVLDAFADSFDAVLFDERSHYSMLDALAGRDLARYEFRHRDSTHLGELLKTRLSKNARPLVVTDGVFASSGAIAPMSEYARILDERPGSALLVDDAHGVGVLGANGRGTLEYEGLTNRPINSAEPSAANCRIFLTATLSKALGGYGGIIPGARSFVEKLKNSSHWFDGISAPPTAIAAAGRKSLELAQNEPELRERLNKNAAQLKNGLRRLGLDVDDFPTPISGISIGSKENMRQIQAALFEQNVAVAFMPKYAGSSGEGAIRLAVFATHDEAMIDELLTKLGKLL